MNTNPRFRADMGTQYLSSSANRPQPELYEELEAAGVLVPLLQVGMYACVYLAIYVSM